MQATYDFGNPEFEKVFNKLMDEALDTVVWDANMLLANLNCEVNTPPCSDIYYTARISRNDSPDWVYYRVGEYQQPWHDYSDYTMCWWAEFSEIEEKLSRMAAIWRYANDRDYARWNDPYTEQLAADGASRLAETMWNSIDSIMGEFVHEMERMLDSVYDSLVEYLRDEAIEQMAQRGC